MISPRPEYWYSKGCPDETSTPDEAGGMPRYMIPVLQYVTICYVTLCVTRHAGHNTTMTARAAWALGTEGTIWIRTHLHCNADYNTGNICTPVVICNVWDLAQICGVDEKLTRM